MIKARRDRARVAARPTRINQILIFYCGINELSNQLGKGPETQ